MIPAMLAALLKDALPSEGNFRVAFQSGDDGNRKGTDIRILRCEDDGAENVVLEIMLRIPKR